MRSLFIALFILFFTASFAQEQSYRLIFNDDQPLSELNELMKLANGYLDLKEDALDSLIITANKLMRLAKQSNSDRFIAEAYYFEGEYYFLLDQRDKALDSYNLSIQFFNKTGYDFGEAKVAYSISEVYFANDNYSASLNYALRALEKFSVQKSRHEVATTLALLCDILTYMGRYDEAINYCIRSLKLQEELEINKGLQITLNAIGNIYKEMGSYEKARSYFERALSTATKANDQYNVATALSNLGNLHLEQGGDVKKALELFQQALSLDSATQDTWGLAYSYHDMGKAFNKLKDYDKAMEYLLKTKELALTANLPEHQANVYITIAENYAGRGRYVPAINELKRALTIAQRINAATMLRNIYRTLSRYYDRLGDKENALVYMRLYTMQVERTYKEESARAIIDAETAYSLDKKEKEIELLKQQKEISELKAQQQTYATYLMALFLLLLLVLIWILYSRIKLKKKANRALEVKNAAINQQKEEIQSQRDDIALKNSILSEKNRQITDSIFYARQIQQSLLPDMKQFNALFPNSFIFYRPKDIVSGDFYWFADLGDKVAFAVIDCTGHGVPGAFMTVLANALLNQIILETGITSPELVISLLDQKIRQNLHQDELRESSTDGLDIALCFFHRKEQKIVYSGAKIPLYYFNEHGEIKQIRGKGYSAGSSLIKNKIFNSKELPYKKGDMLYLSTDGFQDQFGGERDTKFMKSRFKTLLQAIHRKPIVEQEEIIGKSYQQWRNNSPQTDDILVVGIRV